MKSYYNRRAVLFGLALVSLSACVADNGMLTKSKSKLKEMESLVLCENDVQGVTIISKVKAEYGFKRFSKDAYRPVIDRKLFGHEVRVIEFTKDSTKVYVAGTPSELVYNLKKLLPKISCDGATCQAPLENSQSLLIYKLDDARKTLAHKAKLKQVRDTTILECTRPLQEELPEGTE